MARRKTKDRSLILQSGVRLDTSICLFVFIFPFRFVFLTFYFLFSSSSCSLVNTSLYPALDDPSMLRRLDE